MQLLEDMGTTANSFERLDKTKLFFQTVLYSGKADESLFSTWKRLYENEKYKTPFPINT